MQQQAIRDIKAGEYFKRKADSKTVYIKGYYDRASKSFAAIDTEDISRGIFIKASKPVFVGFDY